MNRQGTARGFTGAKHPLFELSGDMTPEAPVWIRWWMMMMMMMMIMTSADDDNDDDDEGEDDDDNK